MNKCFLFVFLLLCLQVKAQQVKERLNRAPVAVTASNGILVSWRSLIDDKEGTTFNVSRNGKRVASGITTKTNFLDAEGKTGDVYVVETVCQNQIVEKSECKAWGSIFTKISISKPPVQTAANGTKGYYRPDDASVGDLDGDGDYEIVLRWIPNNSNDNGHNGFTSPCIFDAYEMDGTLLWRLNLGLNIRSGNHYSPFLVYDFDGDGKAEFICKTAPGTIDGVGRYVSEASADDRIKAVNNSKVYVNAAGHVFGGEEFLTVFDGQNGAAKNTIWYAPNRSMNVGGEKMEYGDWETVMGKPTNYNRGERYNAAVAYLDGEERLPSAIMERGYYTYCFLWAVDWDGKILKTRWLHRGNRDGWEVTDSLGHVLSSGKGASSFGQGVHSISVADVDTDGKDDIVIGGATISHDGKLKCSTGLGHGDAIHLTDLCPDRAGLEVMIPHEERPYGYDVHDAATGELLVYRKGEFDNGRALACDFIPKNRGYEFWTIAERGIFACSDGKKLLDAQADMNFRVYWTGDPYDQTFDGRFNKRAFRSFPRICSYDSTNDRIVTFMEFADYGNPSTCNYTKSVPCLQADLLGDWREEIIMYQVDRDGQEEKYNLVIFSTPEETDYKIPCLMQDHVYRLGVAWQNSSYNQPPHLGFYLPDYLGIDGDKYVTKVESHAPKYVKE